MEQTNRKPKVILVALIVVLALLCSLLAFEARRVQAEPADGTGETTTIDLTGAEWYFGENKYDGNPFTYDRAAKEFKLGGITSDISNLIYTYYVSGSEEALEGAPADVGTYEVKVTAPEGIKLTGTYKDTLTFEIQKKVVDAPTASLSEPTKQEIIEELPAQCQQEHNLKEMDGTSESAEVTGYKKYWRCTVCGRLFEDEDGKVEIESGDPRYIWVVEPTNSISEFYNDPTIDGDLEALKKGEYTVTFTFELIEKNNCVFNTENLPAGHRVLQNGTLYTIILKWNAPETLPGENFKSGNVRVLDKDNVISEGILFNATQQPFNVNDYRDDFTGRFPGQKTRLGVAYDLRFEGDEGYRPELKGSFHVVLPISENLVGYKNDHIKVLYVKPAVEDSEGKIVSEQEIKEIEATRVGDNLEFDVDRFANEVSYYVLLGLDDIPAPVGSWWLTALLGVLGVLLVLALIILIIKLLIKDKGQKDDEPKDDSDNSDDNGSEDDRAQAEQEPEEDPIAEETEATEETEEEATATTEDIIPIVGDNEETRVVYDRSFFAKLAQVDDNIKGMYAQIKNRLMSYKKVNARMSWKHDTYTMGRERLVRFTFSGKNLYMYLALDPDTLDPKYHHISVKDKARYAAIPTKLKIKSSRSGKYALELVDILMTEQGAEKRAKFTEVNYEMPYMTDDELIADGKIKVKEVAATSFQGERFGAQTAENDAKPSNTTVSA